MISDEPKVNPSGRYGVTMAAKLLGVSTSTVYRYESAGYMKAKTRRATGRKFYEGSEIIKVWRIIY